MRAGVGKIPTTSAAQQAPKTARTLMHLKRIAAKKQAYQKRLDAGMRKGI